jgi:hypothetical protein
LISEYRPLAVGAKRKRRIHSRGALRRIIRGQRRGGEDQSETAGERRDIEE